MPFVLEALRRLSQGRLRYCVLRNYQALPRALDGTDLDLLVEAADLPASFRILCEAAARHGGKFISHYRGEALITSFCGHAAGQWWGVQIDLFPGLTHRGVPFYDASGLIRRAQDWHGIPVAPEGEAIIIALLKELLTNSRSRKDYAPKAAAAYASDPACCNARLEALFGQAAVAAFRQYLEDNNSVARMRTAANRLRWALGWRAFRGHPVRVLGTKSAGLLRRLGRLARPPGLMLAVVGADDAARSRLIEKLQPVLGAAVHGHVHHRQLRPGWLPQIGRRGGMSHVETTAANSLSGRPSGAVGSVLRLAYYALDYCLGYWATIYPSLVKRPSIWIFDGYFHDLNAAPLRLGLALPAWVVKGAGWIVPKPDLVIGLDIRSEGSQGRNAVVPPQELDRQAAGRQTRGRRDRRLVMIEGDGIADETADRVLTAIVSRAAARYAQ